MWKILLSTLSQQSGKSALNCSLSFFSSLMTPLCRHNCSKTSWRKHGCCNKYKPLDKELLLSPVPRRKTPEDLVLLQFSQQKLSTCWIFLTFIIFSWTAGIFVFNISCEKKNSNFSPNACYLVTQILAHHQVINIWNPWPSQRRQASSCLMCLPGS